MSEKNKARVRRLLEEVVSQGKQESAEELLAVDFVDNAPMPGVSCTREGFMQTVQTIHASFPDFHVSVEDVVAEGDRVAVRWTATGTHTGGEIMGIPAVGNQVTVPAMQMYRIEDDRIAEVWENLDLAGLVEQLGADLPLG